MESVQKIGHRGSPEPISTMLNHYQGHKNQGWTGKLFFLRGGAGQGEAR